MMRLPLEIILCLSAISPSFAETKSAPSVLTPALSSRKLQREVREAIPVKSMKAELGLAYIATLRLQREADKTGKSKCVLYEDGKPIGPPRALHKDIRELGKGRYSHWTPETLYFSASDSSDPRANGRKYELVSSQEYITHQAECKAKPGQSSFVIQAGGNARIRPVSLRWENLSAQMLIPALRQKGWPDLTSTNSILQSVIKEGMTDEEKAIAIWKFLVDWRYHYYPAEGGQEVHDPIKFINVYGYGFCDDSAANFSVLCRQTGIKSRSYALDGHVVAEAFFGNGWHMFDPDHQVYYRCKDGTVAGAADLEKNPKLITDAKHLPEATSFSYTPRMAELYTTTENNRPFTVPMPQGGTMDFPLAPGDTLEFNSAGADNVHSRLYKDEPLPPVFGNGKHTRRFADLKSLPASGGGRLLEVKCPYVILSTDIEFQISENVKPNFSISLSGENWSPLKVTKQGNRATASAKEWLSQRSACYGFNIRLESDKARDSADFIRNGAAITTFQFAPRAIPQVTAGKNHFVVSVKPEAISSESTAKGLMLEFEWEEILKEKRP
jgi:hypothetical protein